VYRLIKKKQEISRTKTKERPANIQLEKPRVLTIVSKGTDRAAREIMHTREQNDQSPRILLFEDTLHSDILEENFLHHAPYVRRFIYRFIPTSLSQAIEAYCRRGDYLLIVTWGDYNVLLFSLLCKLMFARTPHVGIMSWPSSRWQKRVLLRLTHSHIDRLIFWSSAQRNYVLNALKIAASKVVHVPRRADTKFWRPLGVKADMICSAGIEMRDYPTLVEAVRGLEMRCHIATGHFYGKRLPSVNAILEMPSLPSNVTVSKLGSVELRSLYARSKFVVIPLLASDTDNGVTVIEEAMAMGKAVICSRTKGQVDIIQEGKTGIFVPVGDPGALREAILYLWNNPKIAEEMGRNGRKFIEENHSLEKFVFAVKRVTDEVMQVHAAGGKG
jgi:glycosyltransferase involved in cell wall biosynthesis